MVPSSTMNTAIPSTIRAGPLADGDWAVRAPASTRTAPGWDVGESSGAVSTMSSPWYRSVPSRQGQRAPRRVPAGSSSSVLWSGGIGGFIVYVP